MLRATRGPTGNAKSGTSRIGSVLDVPFSLFGWILLAAIPAHRPVGPRFVVHHVAATVELEVATAVEGVLEHPPPALDAGLRAGQGQAQPVNIVTAAALPKRQYLSLHSPTATDMGHSAAPCRRGGRAGPRPRGRASRRARSPTASGGRAANRPTTRGVSRPSSDRPGWPAARPMVAEPVAERVGHEGELAAGRVPLADELPRRLGVPRQAYQPAATLVGCSRPTLRWPAASPTSASPRPRPRRPSEAALL